MIETTLHCTDCKHPDNDEDPKTGQVIGPVHVVMTALKAVKLSLEAGTMPREFHSREDGMADFCLLCNRMCEGEYI